MIKFSFHFEEEFLRCFATFQEVDFILLFFCYANTDFHYEAKFLILFQSSICCSNFLVLVPLFEQ